MCGRSRLEEAFAMYTKVSAYIEDKRGRPAAGNQPVADEEDHILERSGMGRRVSEQGRDLRDPGRQTSQSVTPRGRKVRSQ